MILQNQNIILGVCGSIAAYKSPDIVRRLQDLGACVKVVLSPSGEKFVSKLCLETVSKNIVFCDLWTGEMEHISLAKWADIILIAPISANTLAKFAGGIADNLLTNIILATKAQIIISPAMNAEMLNNIATQENLKTLKNRGVKIIQSDNGIQACGDIGEGRMSEPQNIAESVADLTQQTKLNGKKIVITLGATIEKIDPVRYISNFSSGKMGVAIANSCIFMGAKVTVIYGNISVELPQKSTNIQALSADEMLDRSLKNVDDCDIFIAVAAVADFKVVSVMENKITKSDKLTLNLEKTVDILATISAATTTKNRPFCVGFAAQTTDLIKNAKNKLLNKNLDMIIANDVSGTDTGFGVDENEVIVITNSQEAKIAKDSKQKIANQIMKIIENQYAN